MPEQRTPKVGQVVIYHDEVGMPAPGLVTAVWSPSTINILIVSTDENKQDDYGRQIERFSSRTHKTYLNAHGNYWRFEDEEPNPIQNPLET